MPEQLSINERIKKISDYFFNGNTSAMARATDIKQATLRDIISKKVKPSYDTIKSIIECSTLKISPEWLIIGRGEIQKGIDTVDVSVSTEAERELMYKATLAKEAKTSRIAESKRNEKIETDTRPRIPYTAAAGSLTSAVEGVTSEQCEHIPRISFFPEYDFTIIIKGDSMEPKYEGGDEVACKRIDNTSFIQWGKPHVLDTAQGILIKRVYENEDKIRCVSYNPEYPDFSIDKNEIYSMSLVVGLVRL